MSIINLLFLINFFLQSDIFILPERTLGILFVHHQSYMYMLQAECGEQCSKWLQWRSAINITGQKYVLEFDRPLHNAVRSSKQCASTSSTISIVNMGGEFLCMLVHDFDFQSGGLGLARVTVSALRVVQGVYWGESKIRVKLV